MPRPSTEVKVLFLRPNGGTAGGNTFVDTVLQAVGLTNFATSLGVDGWRRLSMESLVGNEPDVFLMGEYVRDSGYAAANWSRHPWLNQLIANKERLLLRDNLGSCSTWQLIELAEDLARQMDPST